MNSTDQFEVIVSEHYEPLFRFAMSLTRSESDARDLTQHTFYIWATRGHQLRDISKVKTWLFTTLHRAFLTERRRQNRFPHENFEEVAAQLPASAPGVAAHVDSTDVLSALARVDEVFQAAVALFYLQDCSYKEIALILQVPIGTVKSRIARGIAQLRELLSLEDASVSSPKTNEAPPISVADEQAEKAARARPALSKSTQAFQPLDALADDDGPCSQRVVQNQQGQKTTAGAEVGYGDWDWDLSSTLLPELIELN